MRCPCARPYDCPLARPARPPARPPARACVQYACWCNPNDHVLHRSPHRTTAPWQAPKKKAAPKKKKAPKKKAAKKVPLSSLEHLPIYSTPNTQPTLPAFTHDSPCLHDPLHTYLGAEEEGRPEEEGPEEEGRAEEEIDQLSIAFRSLFLLPWALPTSLWVALGITNTNLVQ